MSLTAYTRFRFLWGAVDWQGGSGNPYPTAATASVGTSAAAGTGNVGVRRASLIFDRSAYSPADDDMTMHFDFMNLTGGNPDDTWTTGDYTTLEAALLSFWTTTKVYSDPKTQLREIRWHRAGVGVPKPNPAERTYVLTTMVPGTGTAGLQVPQVACSITFRTAVRRSWGRTYLPFNGQQANTQGRLSASTVDTIAGAANTLYGTAAAADFYLVVTSLHLSAALNVERVEVDDVLDIIRRRRWKHTTYRKLLP
jgi:hypothetical protein